MNDLKNWTNVTKGQYRYVISAGCYYEIIIMCHYQNTDILTANADLYITSEWVSKLNKGNTVFQRERLHNGTVADCLEEAIRNNKENNS